MQAYGWSSPWETAFEQLGVEGAPGRIIAQYRDRYRVVRPQGERGARLAGRFRHRVMVPSDLPVVGDWVVLGEGAGGDDSILAVLPRQSRFLRRAAGDVAAEQVVAANVDLVWIVAALHRDFNSRRLERYVTLGWESGARPVIVLTKADLVEDAGGFIAAAAEVAPGVPLHAVSAPRAVGLDALHQYLRPGVTVALLGSSGVGKSTLVNTFAGAERLATQPLRRDGKGRHTTTHRELVLLEGGGLLLDTPGMRELGLWDASEGVSRVFSEIESLSAGCRFRDCTHRREPGCAVLEAVRRGQIPPERLAAYHKMMAELAYLESREDPRAARERERLARIANREGRRLLRRKSPPAR